MYQFIRGVKYFEVMIDSWMKTRIDVARQTCKFYLQANLLLVLSSKACPLSDRLHQHVLLSDVVQFYDKYSLKKL